jgi:hypothetical protein
LGGEPEGDQLHLRHTNNRPAYIMHPQPRTATYRHQRDLSCAKLAAYHARLPLFGKKIRIRRHHMLVRFAPRLRTPARAGKAQQHFSAKGEHNNRPAASAQAANEAHFCPVWASGRATSPLPLLGISVAIAWPYGPANNELQKLQNMFLRQSGKLRKYVAATILHKETCSGQGVGTGFNRSVA